MFNKCAKCGSNADWAVVELTAALCIDCEADFGAWCRMMDMKFINYNFSEYLEA